MSFNKVKADPELGMKIHEHLVKCGVETPHIDNGLSRSEKIDIIELKFRNIMQALGLDLDDDSLVETPKRVFIKYLLLILRTSIPKSVIFVIINYRSKSKSQKTHLLKNQAIKTTSHNGDTLLVER